MYKRILQGWQKHLDFIILDLLCLHTAFLLAYMMRMGLGNPYADLNYRNLAIVLTLIDISVLVCFNILKNVLRRKWARELWVTLQHVFLVVLLLATYLFSIREGATFSRGMVFLFAGLYLLISYAVRIIYKRFLEKYLKEKGMGIRSLLIVTNEALADEVVRKISHRNYGGYRISGLAIVDKDSEKLLIGGVPVVANMENLMDYACRNWIDEAFIYLDPSDPKLGKISGTFSEMGIVIHIGLQHPVYLTGQKQVVEKIGGFVTLTSSINTASYSELVLKRLMDIAGGIVGCMITAVLTVVLGPLIYIQSPGPIFFSQVRVGKNGKKFKMYKFRSMYLDAEERKKELEAQNRVKSGMMFKLDFDPRIIGCRKNPDGTIKKGIGNYIRDWSLDEFPQFFNVLKGDMSLVGTRPPTVDEWDKYELHHRARLAIKPGVTGMWQVSGRSDITDFEQVVKLDTQYICDWSLMLDIRLLFETVMVVVGRKGSM